MSLYLRLVNTVVIAACIGVLASCSVYDENRLLFQSGKPTVSGGKSSSGGGGTGDSGTGGGAGGASGVGGSDRGDARAGNAGDVGDLDAAGSQDASAINDEICGNGRVAGTEKCDIAIDPDMPGACPTQCPEGSECNRYVLTGENCQAECIPQTPPCGEDDGCCPSAECTNLLDSDCSASCGDGVVQEDEGETCEPSSALGEEADPGLACPTECPDEDNDPCTEESLLGSEENCNAECSISTITSLVDGDGCCPDGANADTDSDCDPVCGNGAREADEECDGGKYCDDQCKATMTQEQQRCIEGFSVYDIRTDECEVCMCTNCTNELLTCFDSGDAELDMHCTDIVRCGYQALCVGTACYCGSAINPLTGTCLLSEPAGACRTEIETAAGTTDMTSIFFQTGDANTAIGRSTNVSDCIQRNCLNICQ